MGVPSTSAVRFLTDNITGLFSIIIFKVSNLV
jgi:hypothetical protein